MIHWDDRYEFADYSVVLQERQQLSSIILGGKSGVGRFE